MRQRREIPIHIFELAYATGLRNMLASSATHRGGLASSAIRDRGGGHNVVALPTWRRSQHVRFHFFNEIRKTRWPCQVLKIIDNFLITLVNIWRKSVYWFKIYGKNSFAFAQDRTLWRRDAAALLCFVNKRKKLHNIVENLASIGEEI